MTTSRPQVRLLNRFSPQGMAAIVLTIVLGLSTPAWSQGVGGKRDIDVATVNLYVGADFTPVTTLNPAEPDYPAKLVSGVATIYGRIVASNFPARATALAQEIVARGPDIVALQEVSLIRRQSPGDSVVGGRIPATRVEEDGDYLEVLLDALKRYGGHYAVVSQVQNTDVELPLATSPFTFDDVRLTDRDVILARTDLPPGQMRTLNPQGANFAASVPLPIGVSVLRGWCSIDIQMRGRTFRVINAHLEDRLPPVLPDIQGFQTAELLAGPAAVTPALLVGDFNSDANGMYAPHIYASLTAAGQFDDAWTATHPSEAGWTWGHDEFLSDKSHPFSLRIDLVLFRGDGLEATRAAAVDPVIRSSPPFWFSDHAGVFATIRIK